MSDVEKRLRKEEKRRRKEEKKRQQSAVAVPCKSEPSMEERLDRLSDVILNAGAIKHEEKTALEETAQEHEETAQEGVQETAPETVKSLMCEEALHEVTEGRYVCVCEQIAALESERVKLASYVSAVVVKKCALLIKKRRQTVRTSSTSAAASPRKKTGFTLFWEELRKEKKVSMAEAGTAWRQLDDTQKQTFVDQAKAL